MSFFFLNLRNPVWTVSDKKTPGLFQPPHHTHTRLFLMQSKAFLLQPVPLPEFSKESSNIFFSKYHSYNLKVTSYV